MLVVFFFFKQKTAYEMRISDWSSTCALPIFQRIIRIDQRQMRAAALEQGREQRSEMPVDLLERRQQPRAALAVEIADRPAQPVDRLLQLVALGDAGGAAFLNLGEFALGDKIDRAKPFAVARQAFKQGRTLAALFPLGRHAKNGRTQGRER